MHTDRTVPTGTSAGYTEFHKKIFLCEKPPPAMQSFIKILQPLVSDPIVISCQCGPHRLGNLLHSTT